MYNIGDYVIYKRDVCCIKDVEEKYYVIYPLTDNSLTIKVPIDTKFRDLITKEECEKLINSIPNIDIIKDDKYIENEYKKLIDSGNLEDLIKIIKTTYLRNKNRLDSHKKIGEKDDKYFKKAQKLLYTEMQISLGLTYDEVENYIKDKVESLIK